eukprot:COSAG02_NODE_36890_length_449_cov_0.788571_1_plen_32_part_10
MELRLRCRHHSPERELDEAVVRNSWLQNGGLH